MAKRWTHTPSCPQHSQNTIGTNYCCGTCNPEQVAPWDIPCNCGLWDEED